jgi:hypothetical protein
VAKLATCSGPGQDVNAVCVLVDLCRDQEVWRCRQNGHLEASLCGARDSLNSAMTGSLGPHGNVAVTFRSAPEPLNMIDGDISRALQYPRLYQFLFGNPSLRENLHYLDTTFQKSQLTGEICEADRSDADGLAIGHAKAP